MRALEKMWKGMDVINSAAQHHVLKLDVAKTLRMLGTPMSSQDVLEWATSISSLDGELKICMKKLLELVLWY